jgi:hypothetical protein
MTITSIEQLVSDGAPSNFRTVPIRATGPTVAADLAAMGFPATSITYEMIIDGSAPLLSMMEAVRQDYIATARYYIDETFPDGGYDLIVDNKRNVPIELARLRGSIVAFAGGDITPLKTAYAACIATLRAKASVISSSGQYAQSFVIKQNGRRVKDIDWSKITPRSNIEIINRAFYASPLESMYGGSIMLAGRNAARSAGRGEVKCSFTYDRDPQGKGGDPTPPGRERPYYALPTITMGMLASNVTNAVGKIGANRTGARGKRLRRQGKRTVPFLGTF